MLRAIPTIGYALGSYQRARAMGASGAPVERAYLPARAGGGSIDAGERREVFDIPVKSWTYSAMRTAELLAEDGDMKYLAELCETLMGDERINAKLEDRSLALTSAPITFEAAPKGRQRRAAMRAAQAEQDWFDMVPETQIAEMLRWYRMLGLALGELVWTEPDPIILMQQDENGNWYVPNVNHTKPRLRNNRNVPQLRVWHPRDLRWDWRDRCWYLRLDGGYEEKIVPGNGKWVLWANGKRPWIKGLWRGLKVVWLMKALAGPAWGKQSIRHANGTAIMSGPEAYDAELRRQLTREWKELGSEGAIWVPEGSKLDVFELRANTWETYKAQIDTANTAIDIAILGANLPTEVSNGAGTGATAQMMTVQKRIGGDAAEWEAVEHEQIARPWAKANFGTPDVAPWAIRNVEPANDIAQLSMTQKAAAEALRILRDLGAPVNEVEFLQAFKVPIDDERVGKTSKPTLFAWHITSGMLRYGEARSRYDDTLPPDPEFDSLRIFDVLPGGKANDNEAAKAAFAALIANTPSGETNAA